jgi:hypothetical protein
MTGLILVMSEEVAIAFAELSDADLKTFQGSIKGVIERWKTEGKPPAVVHLDMARLPTDETTEACEAIRRIPIN